MDCVTSIRKPAVPLFCLFFGLILNPIVASEAESAFWPQFRGPNRDGVSTSKSLLKKWPEGGPPLLWRTEDAGRGYSSVSIAGGKLFTMGDSLPAVGDKDEYLLCYSAETGQNLWKIRLGPPWTEGPDDWESSRSTPALDGDRVFVLTAHGDLICLDASQRKEVWRKNLKKDFGGEKGDGWGYSESVLVDGDRVICTPGGEKRTLVALNKETGELIWSAARSGDRGAGHASIVISEVGGRRIYVQTTASGALGVAADGGDLLWSYEIDRTTAVIPTPIVRNDLVFFAAGYNRGGALLKQVPAGPGKVRVEEIYPLKRNLENKHGGIVLVGDYLYGDSGDSGRPFCAEFMTGKERWSERGSGRGSASVVAADGHLYIRFSNAVMALAKATPAGYEELGSFRIPGGGDRPSWAHPVVTGGRLYLRENNGVSCYDLRE